MEDTRTHLCEMVYEMEVITAITEIYIDDIKTYILQGDDEVLQEHVASIDDIKTYILQEDDEVLQEPVSSIVYALYKAYMEIETKQSLLDLVNQKTISINEVM